MVMSLRSLSDLKRALIVGHRPGSRIGGVPRETGVLLVNGYAVRSSRRYGRRAGRTLRREASGRCPKPWTVRRVGRRCGGQGAARREPWLSGIRQSARRERVRSGDTTTGGDREVPPCRRSAGDPRFVRFAGLAVRRGCGRAGGTTGVCMVNEVARTRAVPAANVARFLRGDGPSWLWARTAGEEVGAGTQGCDASQDLAVFMSAAGTGGVRSARRRGGSPLPRLSTRRAGWRRGPRGAAPAWLLPPR